MSYCRWDECALPATSHLGETTSSTARQGGTTMAQVHIIGIDLAKQGFQLHGARADGSVAFCKKLIRTKVLDFGLAATLSGGDGGMRVCALLEPRERQTRSRGEDHPSGLREAFCQTPPTQSARAGGLPGATAVHLHRSSPHHRRNPPQPGACDRLKKADHNKNSPPPRSRVRFILTN